MNSTNEVMEKRILVVDDNDSDTQLLKRYLEGNHDCVVCEENDPNAAVSTAEEFKPALILLDVLMPGVDGEELASPTRANPKLKGVPIIFFTAAVTKGEIEARGGKLGGVSFVAKPVVLAEVLACLKHHLGEAEAAQHSGNP